jgi:hypothetical protein
VRRYLISLVLLTLAACQTTDTIPGNPTPTPIPPNLTLTPTSININAGDDLVVFSALVQNSSEAVTWTLTGSGSINPSGGSSVSYTPPASVDSAQGASLTATLGTTGATATAPIAIYPADVTPPEQPPPAPPPSNPPPTDTPTDPPTDPDPTPAFDVTIADVNPVELENGEVGVTLNAITEDAPAGTVTYAWTVEQNPGTFAFSSTSDEDVTVYLFAVGTYVLKVTATSGSVTASDTVSITVNPEAAPNVTGLWRVTVNQSGASYMLSLNLTQTGENVTGDFANGNGVQLSGTFDGTTLKLTAPGDGNYRMEATVIGDTMTGTITELGFTDPFTATRQ